MFKFILRSLLVLFAISFVAGLIAPAINRAGGRPRNKPAQAKNDAKKAATVDLGLAAGYTDGKDMASKGMVKPSAEVVDAMARRRYAEVTEFGADAAFKQNYKSGFWEGWRAGD